MKKISLATRQKVIQLFKEETQIKEIAQILLNRENIKISYGSVWNIIESWRSSQSKSTEPVAEQPLLSEPNGHLVSSTPVLVRESPSVDGPSGCPLSRFIPQTPESQPQIQTPEVKNSDLEGSKGNISITHEIKELQGKDATSTGPVREIIRNQPTYDPYMERQIDIIDPDTDPDLVEPDIYTNPNADYDKRYDGDGPFVRTVNQYPNIPSRRLEIPGTRYNNYSNVIKGTKETSEEESDPASNSLGIDWDENHETRFVKWVMDQKRIRQQEEHKLEEERARIYQERSSIEDQKRVLEVREAKLFEVKDLIPSAAELKSMGIEFTCYRLDQRN
jgi:hypothetical protein